MNPKLIDQIDQLWKQLKLSRTSRQIKLIGLSNAMPDTIKDRR